MANTLEGPNQIQTDVYDSQHGNRDGERKDNPPMSPEDLFGTNQNPVRETDVSWTNLRGNG
jgi:hypothetical protein